MPQTGSTAADGGTAQWWSGIGMGSLARIVFGSALR
jgi:hypothetical protein